MQTWTKFSTLASMIITEALAKGELVRVPEPQSEMNLPDQVASWDLEGMLDGIVAPVYRYIATLCSPEIPYQGTAVDLGCGTGRFATYLAKIRPDIKIVGLDLADNMIAYGNKKLAEDGLSDRVHLRLGDMRSFNHLLPENTSVITSLFALHHLETKNDLKTFFTETKKFTTDKKGSFLFFDLARPKDKKNSIRYLDAFSPNASEIFKTDATASLLAAYSLPEIREAMTSVFDSSDVESQQSKVLPLYQIHKLKTLKKPSGSRGAPLLRIPMAFPNLLNYLALKYFMFSFK